MKKECQISCFGGSSPVTVIQPHQAVLPGALTLQSPLLWVILTPNLFPESSRKADITQCLQGLLEMGRWVSPSFGRSAFPKQRQPAQHGVSAAQHLLLILTSLWIQVLGLFQQCPPPPSNLSLLFLSDSTCCIHVLCARPCALPHPQPIFLISAIHYPGYVPKA